MNKFKGIVFSMLMAGLSTTALVQTPPASNDNGQMARLVDLSVMYSTLHANAPVGTCNCFWMNGGALEVAIPVWRNLSVVGEAGGQTASQMGPTAKDVSLSLFSGMGGLRLRLPNHTRIQPYGQVLAGAIHGFNSEFPKPAPISPVTHQPTVAYTPTGTSLGMVLGGGVDWVVSRHTWIRLPQLDYRYSQLRNLYSVQHAGGREQQNQFRISAGIVIRYSH